MVKPKRVSYVAIFTGLASALYYFESFLPLPVPIPGAKWGISNFPVLIAVLLEFSFGEIMMISMMKSFIGGILSGKILSPTFFMGFTGSILSSAVMFGIMKTKKFGAVGISEIGAFINNTIQILIAAFFIIESKGTFIYYPFMILFGIITGLINAIVANISLRSVKIDRM